MKRVSYQAPSKFPTDSGDRMFKPNPKKGKGSSSLIENPTCGKCRKKHYDYFL